jgi:hypothetical protein
MLGGARRPNYLALACSAINRFLRIQDRANKHNANPVKER